MNPASKLILGFFATLIVFTLFISPVSAQNTQPLDLKSNHKAPQQGDYSWRLILQHNLPCMAGQGRSWISKADGKPAQPCEYFDQSGAVKVAYQVPGGGALTGLAYATQTLYSPPTSSVEYLANVGENMGLVSPAYAQALLGSSGDGVIRPVLKLWQFSRNLSYLAFIFIFVAIGFMIMFRKKLNAQAVTTVQSALPQLVLGLILLTFSYLIAALIVDLSFVGMNIVVAIFDQAGVNIIEDKARIASDGNLFTLWWGFVGNSAWQTVVTGTRDTATGIVTQFTTSNPGWTSPGNEGVISWIASKSAEGLAGLAGTLIGVLLAAAILIGLLIQMGRLFLSLLTSYITVLLYTIAGPFFILIGSVPGKGGSITGWWKTILGNVLVFPAVFATFLFAGMFLAMPDAEINKALPLFAGMPLALLKAFIGYGIVLGSPQVPGMVKKLVGVQDIGAYGQAAMGGFQAGLAKPTSFISGLTAPLQRERAAYKEAVYRYRYPVGQTPVAPNPLVTFMQPSTKTGK